MKEPNVQTPEQRRRAVYTFQYFIKEFRDKIDSPELEIRDLAMGIRGYGIFANVSFLRTGHSKNFQQLFRHVNYMERMKM